ncbi:hypothetical protein EP1X_06515 [Thermococcus sp. EP1]|uniref:hypothetical protein n=1 Tax=Thermococcus sp. EP1 TaxID=1591054 RepID=UPI0006DAC3B7|nr:hypothetical protein [Thermococcus sp. EP1]KPU63006.1 hypothetical protein EP1X_06515 [Thermococcus sp. EP1]
MQKHLKVIFVIALLLFSSMCIGNKETLTTKSSTPILETSEKDLYSTWLRNETKYFTIYYPKIEEEGFNFNIRYLLVGIDYVYESYSKAFGRTPEEVELYIYPSEAELKFDYSTELPWYIEGNKIFAFIEKDAKGFNYYSVESALIAYLTGKVNGLTFIFPFLGDFYFRGADELKEISFDELLSLVDSQDIDEVMDYKSNIINFVGFLVHEYGVKEVLKLLESDSPSEIIRELPNVKEEYERFVEWFWGGGIIKGLLEIKNINLTVVLEEEKAFLLANESVKVEYLQDYYPFFVKSVYLNIRGMSTQYLQSFSFLLPYEQRETYEIYYIGNYSIQPLTYDEDIHYALSGKFVTPNMTLLGNGHLFPQPVGQYLPQGKIEVKSQNIAFTTTLPSQDVFLATGKFKSFKGFVNGTSVEFYYTGCVETPSTVFKQALSAFRYIKEWFEVPTSQFKVVYTEEGVKEKIYWSRDLLVYRPWQGYHELYFVVGLYHSWFDSVKIKPRDIWVLRSLSPLLEAIRLDKLEDYKKSAVYLYKTNLRDFPESGYPLVESYKYFYSDRLWMKNSMVYKGFLTFYLLYTHTGEEAFKEALREFSEKTLFKEADFEDFVKLLAEKSGNNKVLLIWKTWTTKPALPNLTLENVEILKTDVNYTLKFTLVDTNGFAFPFEIMIIGWQGQRVEVEGFYYGKPQEVEILLSGEPKEIIISGAPFLSKNFDIEVNGSKIYVTIP